MADADSLFLENNFQQYLEPESAKSGLSVIKAIKGQAHTDFLAAYPIPEPLATNLPDEMVMAIIPQRE